MICEVTVSYSLASFYQLIFVCIPKIVISIVNEFLFPHPTLFLHRNKTTLHQDRFLHIVLAETL